ncbi:MAG: acyl-CoA/acyl-ACP dehydrogenase [Burkholderiales bacterium]|nr:acyl-CoA/acyl-ACP dehydrogenase [Burkholderiales bacterium]
MQIEAISAVKKSSASPVPEALAALIASDLAPKVTDIDLKGEYPGAFLQALGRIGGFAGAAADEIGLRQVIRVMEDVSRECMSTGFLVWCQSACAWYLHNTTNSALRQSMLPAIARGEVLAGTGLSNPMKSCAAIENIRLQAKKAPGGYVVNGALPWVSNIGPGHYFAFGAGAEGRRELLVGLVSCDTPGLTLNQNAHFVALEGTNTFACHFKDVFVPDAEVIAHPDEFDAFVARIKSGFILNQMGMGLGLIDACVDMMKQSNKTLAHVNCYLDDQADDIEQALTAARTATYDLADKISHESRSAYLREVLQVRITGSELSLKAANAAMLHMGAKGYLLRNPAQRRLREAYFIAIVTPALKHLRKELAEMGSHPCACQA